MPFDSEFQQYTAKARGLLRVEPLKGTPVSHVSIDPPPPPGVRRWVYRRKAAVIAAILSGKLTIDRACEMYGLSAEEILSWRNMIEKYGPTSLRTTCLQSYRRDQQTREAS
jgi:transposase-like protein